jgi:hypothetical protein
VSVEIEFEAIENWLEQEGPTGVTGLHPQARLTEFSYAAKGVANT